MIARGRPRARALVLAAAVGVVGLVAGAGLVGCTGSDAGSSPTLTPLPSSMLTSTADPSSATPSPSASLPAAKAGPPPRTPFTKQGAEVFVRSYYLTLDA